jgi:transposase
MKQRMASKGLIVNKPKELGGGTTLSPAGKAAASNVKDKSIKTAETVKNTMLNNKRGAAYSKCIEKGGDEKKCMRYASSIMASKEYYSDLRKRLIENYKK